MRVNLQFPWDPCQRHKFKPPMMLSISVQVNKHLEKSRQWNVIAQKSWKWKESQGLEVSKCSSIVGFKSDTWTILYLSFNLAIHIPLQIPHWDINLQSHMKWMELRWIPCGNASQKVAIHPKSGLGGRSRGKYVSNTYSRLSDITPLTNYQRTHSCSCNCNGNGTDSFSKSNVVYLTSKDDLLYGYIKVECPFLFWSLHIYVD